MGITERKEKEKIELRQHILNASVKLFSEYGYDGVSIRKIADIIEYSPTTVYLYFKDKNEILFELHQIGFKKMEQFNKDLFDIKNPLLRLHKLGENYIRFGLENPDYYDLMFILPAPIDFINKMKDCDWQGGDNALNVLRSILQECIDKKLIHPGDINTMAMAIWGMVHGLVSLAIRKRFEKLLDEKDVVPTMNKSINWLINTMDHSG
jgi:AcrR family transcriptional regulator